MICIVKKGEFEIASKLSSEKEVDYDYGRLIGPGEEGKDIVSSIRTSVNKPFNRKKIVKMCRVSHGSLFGEEDILLERPRQNTVKCTSTDGVLYCIKKEEFIKKLKGGDTWDKVVEGVTLKEKIHKNRLQNNM